MAKPEKLNGSLKPPRSSKIMRYGGGFLGLVWVASLMIIAIDLISGSIIPKNYVQTNAVVVRANCKKVDLEFNGPMNETIRINDADHNLSLFDYRACGYIHTGDRLPVAYNPLDPAVMPVVNSQSMAIKGYVYAVFDILVIAFVIWLYFLSRRRNSNPQPPRFFAKYLKSARHK